MKIISSLLLLALVVLVSARIAYSVKDSSTPAETYHIKRSSSRELTERCRACVVQYPVKGLRLHQANDSTNQMARSYYRKFSISEYHIRKSNGRPTWNQFRVAIEYKTPKHEYSSDNKQVKINFYNLLFTASLMIGPIEQGCRGNDLTLVGFVELVRTDVTWYKGVNNISEWRQCKPADDDTQYVITKWIPGNKFIFANYTSWGRTILYPLNIARMVPLKYESAENIVVNFTRHRDTTEYEKLIEKKIFLVQTDLQNVVIDVIAGVDVMMYLDLKTNITGELHLDVTTNHSLIRRITDPHKYISMINNLNSKAIRQEPDCLMHPPWSSISTLNPIPKGVRVYTE